ncbi:MAG: VWA domain-containing protein [Planctomycetes bacterium]|nr:VWA domain-containing protein [Planctomycetota bacterium]
MVRQCLRLAAASVLLLGSAVSTALAGGSAAGGSVLPPVAAGPPSELLSLYTVRPLLRAYALASTAPPLCLALDRSGSMTQTDPERFGPSVINLMADLASGSVVSVFTLSGVGPAGVIPLGSFNVADPAQLEALRARVAELASAEPRGETPLADAVDAIYQHLQGQNAPAGASCALITDGEPYPDTERQYGRVEERLADFAAKGWRLHVVALGAFGGVERFHDIARQLGGTALTANTARELLGVATYAFAAFTSESPPVLITAKTGADGRAVVPIEVDPTIRRLKAVVTRPDAAFSAVLVTPRGSQIAPGDSRLVGYNADDPHYVFFSVADTMPLGAGKWLLEVRGPRGSDVHVAVSMRSSLRLVLTAPTGGLFPAGRPARVCSQLLDGDRPLLVPGATVRVTATGADGRKAEAQLLDNGRAENDDANAADGTFCGRLSVPAEGGYRLLAEATTPGAGRAATEGGLLAAAFPSFRPLPVKMPTVRDGDVVSAPIAQLNLAGGRVPASTVEKLTLVVRPPGGAARSTEPDQRAALDQEGVLTASFVAKYEDLLETSPNVGMAGGNIPYTLAVEATYRFRGQEVTDREAVLLQFAVRVLPMPWPCGGLGPLRDPCARFVETGGPAAVAGVAGAGAAVVAGVAVLGALAGWALKRKANEPLGSRAGSGTLGASRASAGRPGANAGLRTGTAAGSKSPGRSRGLSGMR